MSPKSWLWIFSLCLVFSLFFASAPQASAARPQPTLITVDNPYDGGTAYKGQLHAHTENCSAAALETTYRDAGFNFIAITDHDKWTPSPSVPGITHLDGIEKTIPEGHEKVIWAESATSTIEYYEANHPNRTGNTWTNTELSGNTQINGLEVYNPSPTAESEDKWDFALLNPIKRKIWGSAVDDYHGTSSFTGGKGWVMVFAPDCTPPEILSSLKAGNFYATTGPTITISVEGSKITLTTSSSSTIQWKKSGGRLLKATTGVTVSSYQCNGKETYVRAVVTRSSDGKKAWTQPFFINK
jgi:hypothetical protein